MKTQTSFSAHARQGIIENLKQHQYDLIIIGGGITGAGIALDAVSRGIKTCLVEKGDFASGTSSRSTKLIHGGLRYLKQMDFKLVAEVGKERKTVLNIANHLTYPQRVLLPFTKKGSLKKGSTKVALWLYEWLSGVNKEDKHRMLSTEEILEKNPQLDATALLGGADYVEYKTDDARLTLEIIKKAYEMGADILSNCSVQRFLETEGNISGVLVTDCFSQEHFSIKGNQVVNAAGPWMDEVRNLALSKKQTRLLHTKGIHLVFDEKQFPLAQAMYFDTPDKRMIFAIPHNSKVYVGTTDTVYNENLNQPNITKHDVEYVLTALRAVFPNLLLRAESVESGWSGIRPLINQPGKSPSEVSRKDEIFTDANGLLSIAGGKLTGYRKMAEKIVNQVAKQMDVRKKCTTDTILLSGAVPNGIVGFETLLKNYVPKLIALGINEAAAKKLIQRHGGNINTILTAFDKEAWQQTHIPLDLFLSLHYSLHHEMTLHLTDFYIRRTGLLYFDIQQVKDTYNDTSEYMAVFLNWNEEQKQAEIAHLEQALKVLDYE